MFMCPFQVKKKQKKNGTHYQAKEYHTLHRRQYTVQNVTLQYHLGYTCVNKNLLTKRIFIQPPHVVRQDYYTKQVTTYTH